MLEIYFDEYLLDNKWVRAFTQEALLFNSQFKLGSTICRVFTLDIDKRFDNSVREYLSTNSGDNLQTNSLEYILAVNKISLSNYKPNKITIYEDNELQATLFVDELNSENNAYYSYVLADSMVKLNKEFVYDINSSLNVKQLVQLICSNHGISLTNSSFYLSDMVVTWEQEGMTERDFIGYVAEVNGGYAYINASGNLVIKKYDSTIKKTIDVAKCSSFTLGEQHIIDRVYVELASATKYYPETSNNETCYLDSNNILLTDSGSYTIDGIVQHIYNDINGLSFYNIIVERYPISNVLCGDFVKFKLGDNEYPSIVQIDWTYANGWLGGFNLAINTSEQQETQIVSPTKKSEGKLKKEVTIIVDRETGEIKETVSRVNEDLSTSISNVSKTADGISLKASTLEQSIQDSNERIVKMETALDVKSDGVYITQGTEGEYTKFTDSGMEIYSGGQKVAWATQEGFNAEEYLIDGWHIKVNNNGNTLSFFKKGS